MRPVDEPQRRDQERRANTARRSSRLLAPSPRSGDFTSMIARQPKTLAAINPRGSQPITPEPAPSPRLGASAGARPFTDTITLTRTPKIQAPKGTFLLCWKRGHFHFALTPWIQRVDNAATENDNQPQRAIGWGEPSADGTLRKISIKEFACYTDAG